MNTQILKGTITDIKRLANSYNGNPNFKIILKDNNGHELIIGTINDSMVNCRVSDVMLNQEVEMKVKVNIFLWKSSNNLNDLILLNPKTNSEGKKEIPVGLKKNEQKTFPYVSIFSISIIYLSLLFR